MEGWYPWMKDPSKFRDYPTEVEATLQTKVQQIFAEPFRFLVQFRFLDIMPEMGLFFNFPPVFRIP